MRQIERTKMIFSATNRTYAPKPVVTRQYASTRLLDPTISLLRFLLQLDHFATATLRLSLSFSLPVFVATSKERGRDISMVMWVFGYGSLIWKAGFNYDDRRVGFIKGYRRVFYQGSTDHRGTPEYPGRTVTLEPADGEVCWGVAYKISKKEDEEIALTYLEVREKQYDQKAYLDFYTDPSSVSAAISGVMVYIGSADKNRNVNYLGPAPLQEIAEQIVHAEGPSGPNRDYLFQLETALLQIGCKDKYVMDLAKEVRRILSE